MWSENKQLYRSKWCYEIHHSHWSICNSRLNNYKASIFQGFELATPDLFPSLWAGWGLGTKLTCFDGMRSIKEKGDEPTVAGKIKRLVPAGNQTQGSRLEPPMLYNWATNTRQSLALTVFYTYCTGLCTRHLAATQYVPSELHRLEIPHYRGLSGLMVTQWSQLSDQTSGRDPGFNLLAFSLSSTSPHTYQQTGLVPSPHTPPGEKWSGSQKS